MNIQIFGTRKCFDTKKAERYFKERGNPVSVYRHEGKGNERRRIPQCGRCRRRHENLIDRKCKDKALLALIDCTPDSLKASKILENQKIIRTPVVRNGRMATVGYCPEIWKTWE